MPPLTDKHKRQLRALAHDRKPVVLIGQAGLTEAVLLEIEAALAHHELIKVKVGAADRDIRAELIGRIADRTGADVVQTIGHIAAFYRKADKPKIALD